MNFDQFTEESKQLSKPYTMYGETYYLPPFAPVGLMLLFRDMQKKGLRGELRDEVYLDLFTNIFGADNLAEWSKHSDFTLDKMLAMLTWAMREYGMLPKEQEQASPNVTQVQKGRKSR